MCSPTDALRSPLPLPERWWSGLKTSLESLADASTHRTNSDQQQVTERIQDRFGHAVDTAVDRWETVHGDLHWSNLVHPQFGLLDWELWGRGPAGTDAATLHCYSRRLLVPAIAKKIHAMFAEELSSPTDLAEPLTRRAHCLLASSPT